jgi:hypothetical protein
MASELMQACDLLSSTPVSTPPNGGTRKPLIRFGQVHIPLILFSKVTRFVYDYLNFSIGAGSTIPKDQLREREASKLQHYIRATNTYPSHTPSTFKRMCNNEE